MIDADSKNAMKDILLRLNGQSSVRQPSETSVPADNFEVSDNINEMKRIMEGMLNVEATAISNDAQTYSDLREAITTTVSDTEVKFEQGHTITITNNSGKKRYNVVTSEHEIIANDLVLYEAAHGIVKLLNKGEIPLSNKIRHIIVLEERYNTHLQNSLMYKKRYAAAKANNNTVKMDIYESKYGASRAAAIKYRDSLRLE